MHDDRKQPSGEVARIGPALEFELFRPGRVLARSRGWIGISTVGADEAVDHRLETGWRLIPVHRGYDHDPVSSRPHRIDLVHPVIDLADRMIGIARAGPVAERHRGRDAGLAGMDGAAIF